MVEKKKEVKKEKKVKVVVEKKYQPGYGLAPTVGIPPKREEEQS